MVIPTSSKMWRQDGICIRYGFDRLYSRKEYALKECDDSWLNDKLLFEYAASIDKTGKQPFFSMILTSSTHSPYKKMFEEYAIPFRNRTPMNCKCICLIYIIWISIWASILIS